LDKERGRERNLSWLSLYFCFRQRPKKKRKSQQIERDKTKYKWIKEEKTGREKKSIG
jgi:hypothetical protein